MTSIDLEGFDCNNQTPEATIHSICDQQSIPAMDCCVVHGTQTNRFSFGIGDRQQGQTSDLNRQSCHPHRFLIASITKPIVAIAVLKLAAEGRLNLSARIPELLPRFRNSTYRRITIRHLLTHSSGLAESVVDNLQLRQASASIADFMAAAETEALIFPPGSQCKYSSIGYQLLGTIVENLSGQTLADYLHTQIFEPLQMMDTSLGTEPNDPTVVTNALPVWQHDADSWGWNSNYWKQFGAAWGGIYSTAEDLIRLAQMLLNDGISLAGTRVLPSAVVRSVFANQTAWIRSQPEFEGPAKDWSFGFRMQWPAHSAAFGDFVSEQTIGHWGATGTLLWIDPAAQSAACVLTPIPFEKSRNAIQQISNLLACFADC